MGNVTAGRSALSPWVTRSALICATARHVSARPGTAFHLGATYLKARVRLEGDRQIYEREADTGYRIRFHFCPNCGSTIYWEGDCNPAVCGVAVGAFEIRAFPPPSDSIFDESVHDWLGLPPAMGHHQPNRPSGDVAAKLL